VSAAAAREELAWQRRRAAGLHAELEAERAAAEGAASEAMSRIGSGEQRRSKDGRGGEGKERMTWHGGTHKLGRRIENDCNNLCFRDENIFTSPQ
jgi:hypothetical protein